MKKVKQLLNVQMVGKKGFFLVCLDSAGDVYVYQAKKDSWKKIMKVED